MTDPAQDGVVISTRPGSGSRIEVGSTVRFVVGRLEQTDDGTTAPPIEDGAGNGGTVNGTGNNGNATGQNRRHR